MFYSRLTKERALEELKKRGKDFLIAFMSGSNLHPNPKLYKYHWWIFSLESKENSAAEVFYKDEHKLTTKEFITEYDRLCKDKISFAYVNSKSYRLGAVFNYDKLKNEFPDIEFAPKYEDDTDEMAEDGHK